MKQLNEFGDILSMVVGMFGSLLKGLKSKLHASSIILGMLIAGVLTYSILGVIEYYYSNMPPKFVILISFCVGWVANEITSKLDLFVNDMYEMIIEWFKSKLKSNKK